MKSKRMAWVMFAATALSLLTGCWNSRELKDLGFVMAMGVDKSHDAKKYNVSFQVVNPSAVAPGTTGGGGGGGIGVTPVTVYTGSENTLYGAIRKTSKQAPRQLFFGHNQLLVIGESLAKEGINELFDFYDRSHEFRLTSAVLISRNMDAESILKTLTPIEKIPSNGIKGRIDNSSEIWGENIKVDIQGVIKALVSGEPMISGITASGDPRMGGTKANLEQTKIPSLIELKGIGLFKDGKLKHWMDGSEARGAMWVQNKVEGTVVDLDCMDLKDAVSIDVTRSKTEVRVEFEEGMPVFHIHVVEEGNISGVRCSVDLGKQKEIEKLEKQWNAETEKEVKEAVKTAQKYKSDMFRFGEAVYRADPKAWSKLSGQWDDIFAECKVIVKAEAYIRRPGMEMKPYLTDQKKSGTFGKAAKSDGESQD